MSTVFEYFKLSDLDYNFRFNILKISEITNFIAHQKEFSSKRSIGLPEKLFNISVC